MNCPICENELSEKAVEKQKSFNRTNILLDSDKYEVHLDLISLIDRDSRQMILGPKIDATLCMPCWEKLMLEMLEEIKNPKISYEHLMTEKNKVKVKEK